MPVYRHMFLHVTYQVNVKKFPISLQIHLHGSNDDKVISFSDSNDECLHININTVSEITKHIFRMANKQILLVSYESATQHCSTGNTMCEIFITFLVFFQEFYSFLFHVLSWSWDYFFQNNSLVTLVGYLTLTNWNTCWVLVNYLLYCASVTSCW